MVAEVAETSGEAEFKPNCGPFGDEMFSFIL